MLDKTLPYYNILMHRQAGTPVPGVSLPDGFSFVKYSAGDELAWAEIEASVGEFSSVQEACSYFGKHYLPFSGELDRRTIFIETESGEKVETFTMWWEYTEDLRVPSVHWVAVKPEFQGLGLGKAIVFAGMERSLAIEGDRDFYLHTQTWSYQAIGIYLKAGFQFMEAGSFGGYENDFSKALPILRGKIRDITC